MEHDLSELERRLEALNQSVTDLNSIGLTKKLLAISRRPGWTTIAEFSLVLNAVESLTHSMEGHIQESTRLLEAAQQIKSTGAVSTAA